METKMTSLNRSKRRKRRRKEVAGNQSLENFQNGLVLMESVIRIKPNSSSGRPPDFLLRFLRLLLFKSKP